MKSIIDLLREANREDMVSAPTKIEVKRLSARLGEPFVLSLKPVAYDAWRRLAQSEKEDYRSGLIALSCADLRDSGKDVLEKFGAADAPELIRSILNAGEIAKISQTVEQISGFGDSIEELKKK